MIKHFLLLSIVIPKEFFQWPLFVESHYTFIFQSENTHYFVRQTQFALCFLEKAAPVILFYFITAYVSVANHIEHIDTNASQRQIVGTL